MPDTPHPTDALIPAMQAVLRKAYDMGAEDAVERLLAAAGGKATRAASHGLTPRKVGPPRAVPGIAKPGTIRAAILAAAKNGPFVLADVADALGKPRNYLSPTVTESVRRGELVCVGRGIYALPPAANGSAAP